MPRIERVDVGNYIYHVINRANAKVQIFDNDEDHILFENILEEATEKFDMRILSYCVMPNHWHLILHPKNDGDMSRFMGWLTNTHTRRWHVKRKTIGQGHLYQGRYKSFMCQEDDHFLILARYVERNAKKANLVKEAENWRWCSAWRRGQEHTQTKKLLSPWPISRPKDYLIWLNKPQTIEEEEAIENSITKSSPYGGSGWIRKLVKEFGLEQTLRKVGRPRNGNGG